jgi:hypothetical protein
VAVLADVLGVVLPDIVLVSVLPEPVVPVVPDAPIDVPLPVVPVVEPEVPMPDEDAVSVDVVPLVEPIAEPVPVEAVELLVSAVDGVDGSVVDVDDEVDVSASLRSPQAARDMAATMASAAQRARGVAFIRTLL